MAKEFHDVGHDRAVGQLLSSVPEGHRQKLGHLLRLIQAELSGKPGPVRRASDSPEQLNGLADVLERVAKRLRVAAERAPGAERSIEEVHDGVTRRVEAVRRMGYESEETYFREGDLESRGFKPFEHTPHTGEHVQARVGRRRTAALAFLRGLGVPL